MNFSGISNQTVMGKLMRLPLRLIPSQMRVPILQGRLKGKRWIAGARNHGCWLGSYEYDKQVLFEKIVTEGSIVFDVGAHVGFYTLLASVLVGPKGRVFAFEPFPANFSYLKQHLRLNHITNVTAIAAAVSDSAGTAYFENGTHSSQSHLALQGSLQVETLTLDDLIERGQVSPPDYIKIDVEGAEMLVLSGARALLAKHHPTIFLATHGPELHQQCCQFLSNLGYQLNYIGGSCLEKSDEILAVYNANILSK